jgi:hypothetical protein
VVSIFLWNWSLSCSRFFKRTETGGSSWKSRIYPTLVENLRWRPRL